MSTVWTMRTGDYVHSLDNETVKKVKDATLRRNFYVILVSVK